MNEEDSTCLPAQQQFVRALNSCFPLLKIIILAFHYPYIKTSYQWHGSTVIPYSGRNKGKLTRLVLWAQVWRALNKLKRESQVVGLCSFWCSETALIGRYFGQFNRIRHLIWICGQDARSQNRLVKYIRPVSLSLIAMSDFLADEFYRNHHIRPNYIVYNGIEPSLYDRNDHAQRDVDIIGIGSLIPLKQFELLITVVQKLRQKRPAIRALICGQGPEQANLEALISRLDLRQHIVLTGEKPHTEILQLMQRSKVLLHPSSYEGFSGVCLEALYAGAHVISFCKPVKHPVTHWHIVENVNAMFEKAREILESPNIDQSPVLVNDMKSSAMAIMRIFDYSDPAIS